MTNGSSSDSAGPAVQRLGHPGAEQLGDLDDLALGADRALADEHRDLLTRVEHVGGAPQIRVAWPDDRLQRTRPTRGRARGRAGGSEYSASWMSLGTITQVTDRVALAMRTARSIRCAACSGAMHTCTNSLATSLNRVVRSTSCWKLEPSAIRACWPTIATTGAWSSLAS